MNPTIISPGILISPITDYDNQSYGPANGILQESGGSDWLLQESGLPDYLLLES